jgi:exopolyphosphatase/guanosine-5'-triphosphate,3'-diphosphate pyrophosphatase
VAGGRVIAVIDVGSNSVRLLVARELSDAAFEVVDEQRFDARLGEGQAGGELTAQGFERGLMAMRIMSQVAASHGPSITLAAGTEALRRATNADAFVDAVHDQTGLAIRVLSAEEEAAASFLGVVNSSRITSGHVLDLGGGSLELMDVGVRFLTGAQSAPLGAIYASERYLKSDLPAPKEVRALRRAVRQQLEIDSTEGELWGVGGAIRNIARIVRLRRRYPLRRIHGLVITRREMTRLANDLVRVSAETRRRMPGVSSARADILPAAAVVVDETMALLGAETMTVAGQGLREGLVWQQIRGEAAVLPDVRTASIRGLALANGLDERAAEPVVVVAAKLFDATRDIHGLGGEELDLLLSASRLASVGVHVDYYNRERHAEYLVHAGDLHGFTHREIVLLGALVRSADTGTPDLSLYRAVVDTDDGRRVTTLAAILGTARAIRRRYPSPVEAATFEVDDTALTVHLTADEPLDVEVYELQRQARRVEAALKLELKVEVDRAT